MLDERQFLILETLVRSYIRDGFPVSSQFVAARLPFSVSSATVRNEMVVLEEEGYLVQPHVSAGRIPTVSAFRSVVSRMRKQRSDRAMAAAQLFADGTILDMHRAARKLAGQARAAVFVAAGPMTAFSGFEFLFAAPEFHEEEVLVSFAQLMDTATYWRQRLQNAMHEPLAAFIADENPILPTEHFSIIAAQPAPETIAAVVGPIRMHYDRAFSVLDRFCFAPHE